MTADDSPYLKSRRVRGRPDIRAAAARAIRCDSRTWAEFGVRSGKSARHLLTLLSVNGTLHLFDSWEGLPEPWHRRGYETAVPVGHFKCDQPDLEDDRCRYWPGLFAESLPDFAEECAEQIALAHLDCDLYSSTKTVFDEVGHLFGPGTVLLFDDFFGYPLYREHQWKAWIEWIEERPHEWVAHTAKGQAAVRLA